MKANLPNLFFSLTSLCHGNYIGIEDYKLCTFSIDVDFNDIFQDILYMAHQGSFEMKGLWNVHFNLKIEKLVFEMPSEDDVIFLKTVSCSTPTL